MKYIWAIVARNVCLYKNVWKNKTSLNVLFRVLACEVILHGSLRIRNIRECYILGIKKYISIFMEITK